ncbi:hypothetical protein [Campylobacter jejuni]|nr:hypothetical protein [Campylobacter jejuni]
MEKLKILWLDGCADIAYTRAYVASDRNNDGYLEDYELEDTKVVL